MNEELRKVKGVEIEILQEFMEVCDSLNLRWYVAYGTALGVIRHKGFIPWDDDVDVVMPRKDYDIFCEKAKTLLPDNYFVQTLETEEEYYQPFAKLRKSDTTFWEKGTEKDNINHGIYIDIFPLDGYPTNFLAEKLFMIKRIIYNNFLYQGGRANELSGYRKWLVIFYKLFFGTMTKKEAALKKDILARRIPYSEGKLVSCLVADTPKDEAVPSEVYGVGREEPFEHIKCLVPDKCEVYLEHLFGDYMQFPPEDKRVPLHTCVVIDTEKSYLEYRDLGQPNREEE